MTTMLSMPPKTAEEVPLLKDRATGMPIPLEGVSVDAEIVDGSVRTVISQRFSNKGGKPVEAVYVFPLEEGAAVCAFEALISGRVIRGAVEEREKAFEIYDKAMEEGHGAFLLDEERPDVFTLSVGNLPPKGEAVIRITTVAEAPREGDGLRWVLPTTVSPRYSPEEDRKGVGRPPSEAVNPPVEFSVPYGLELAVTVEMASDIRSVESPSHPIAVETSGRRAVVRLGERRTALDRDFVLLVRAAEPEAPRAVVEKGADGGGAVKLVFPPVAAEGPTPGEVLFLVDRSGSMGGTSIDEARNALQLALRSVPSGVLFNIAGFGSTFESLFPKSRKYCEETLAEATRWVAGMDADLEGTEILPALARLLSGEPPEAGRVVFVLTDGEVSNTDAVIDLVSRHSAGTRLFTFGIGAGASLALVRGMARAGNGACELIAPGERIEAKVVRQLSRALKGGLATASLDWGGLPARSSPARLGSVFPGEPTVVYALVDRLKAATVTLTTRGTAGPVSVSAAVEPEKARAGLLVATLAARGLIRDLEEGEYTRRGSRQKRHEAGSVNEKIVRIAKEYGLASRETSFVAVEERKNPVTGDVDLIHVPVALTRGWGGLEMHSRPVGALTWAARALACQSHPAPNDGFRLQFDDSAQLFCTIAASDITSRRADDFEDEILQQPRATERPLDRLVRLQRAEGFWMLDEEFAKAIGKKLSDLESRIPSTRVPADIIRRAFATTVALAYLDAQCAKEKSEWTPLADKARAWLTSRGKALPIAELERVAAAFVRPGGEPA